MRFTIRNILLMSTTAAFMPLLGAAFRSPFFTYPYPGSNYHIGDKVDVQWYVMKMKLGKELISG
jgi:hypothetical protein